MVGLQNKGDLTRRLNKLGRDLGLNWGENHGIYQTLGLRELRCLNGSGQENPRTQKYAHLQASLGGIPQALVWTCPQEATGCLRH